jgi:hypothetical protein
MIFYNSSNLPDQLVFEAKDKSETAPIPVISDAFGERKYMNDPLLPTILNEN